MKFHMTSLILSWLISYNNFSTAEINMTYLGRADIPVGKSGVKFCKTASNMMGLNDFPDSRTLLSWFFALESSGMSKSDINSTKAFNVG